MEAEGWNVRECSVRLWRCDRDVCESSAKPERGGRPAPHQPVAHIASHAVNHTKEYPEVPVVFVKMEYDVKEAVVSHGQCTGLTHCVKDREVDVGVIVKQTEQVVKTEDSAHEIMIKQELDIGPTVVQLQTAPGTQAGPTPRPGPGFRGDAVPVPLHTVAKPAPQIEGKDNYCEEYSGTLFDTNSALDARGAGDAYRGALALMETREGAQGSNYVKPPSENCADYGADMSTAKPDAHYERDDYKHVQIRYRTGRKSYKCSQCGYSTSHMSHIKTHLRTHTKERPYKCEQCDYSASAMGTLKIHLRTHTDEKPYKCKQCEYNTSQLGHLKIHLRTHTGEKPYRCAQCEYSSSQSGGLKKHMRSHTGEKPYKCVQCEYSASQSGDLKKHMRTHTGEKPHRCKQCKYSTCRLSSLKVHMRIHTGEKPYKCKQCEYSTSYIGSLRTHVRTHTGEKPYKCEHCEYSASQITHLITHMRTHTGERPYKCKWCEYRASQVSNIKIHMRTHADEKPRG